MKFVVELPPETVDKIKKIIGQRQYRSVQDFLYAAAENQLNMEAHPTEILDVIDRQTEREAIEGSTGISSSGRTSRKRIESLTTTLHYLSSPNQAKVHTTTPPDSDQVMKEIPGLCNRLLPVKITTRVLAKMLEGDGSTVPLASLQENAASSARDIGKQLSRRERDLGRPRSEMIAIGLPTKRDEFKAKARFKAHFVGYVSKRRIEGAPATLRFINMIKDQDGKVTVGLTAAGLEFANKLNPVLDRDDFAASLSEEERTFLIEHIATELPHEAQLMRTVLKTIKGGGNDPGSLDKELRKLKPEFKEAEISTLRSGVLSRIAELKLLGRKREGLSVRYEVTAEGEQFLKEVKP